MRQGSELERPELDREEGHRLAHHLAEPCARCWRRLSALPVLALPDAEPSERPPLPASRDAVVCALRTLGGWPPRRWLRPDRRDALDHVREPGGFLRLVIEEAHNLATLCGDHRADFAHWVERLRNTKGAPPPLHVRAALYLARLDRSWGPLLGASSLVIHTAKRFTEGDLGLSFLLLEAHGAVAETIRHRDTPAERHAYCAAVLLATATPARRAETLAKKAFQNLRDRQGARQLLDLAEPLIDSGTHPLLAEACRQGRAADALLDAWRAEHALTRLGHLARGLGLLGQCVPIPGEIDGALCHHLARLVCQVEDLQDLHRSHGLAERLDGGQRRNAIKEAHLRIVLAGACPPEDAERRNARALGELIYRNRLAGKLSRSLRQLEDIRERFADVRAVRELLDPRIDVLRRLLGDHSGRPKS